MVDEQTVADTLRGAGDLRAAATALVKLANDAGGRDNITVVLFRLEELAAGDYDAQPRRSRPRRCGRRRRRPAAGAEGEAAPRRRGRAESDRRAGARQPAAAVQEVERRVLRRPPARRRGAGAAGCRADSSSRWSLGAILIAGGYLATQAVYFVGVDDDGLRHRLPRRALRRARACRSTARPTCPASAPRSSTQRQRETVVDARAAVTRGRRRPGAPVRARQGRRSVSARNRELFGLLPATLLVMAGFGAVFIQRRDEVADASLTYGVDLPGPLPRRTSRDPRAPAGRRPVRLPDRRGARQHRPRRRSTGSTTSWRASRRSGSSSGWRFFTLTIIAAARLPRARALPLPDRRGAASLLLLLPRVPGVGSQVNGAYLGIDFGPLSFQPAEFAKIGIIIFLASYLRDTRQLLVAAERRGRYRCRSSSIWGRCSSSGALAMVMLVVIRDLGSSLMFFGGFLAMLYVATNRSPSRSRASGCSRSARGSSRTPSATSRAASTRGATRSTRRSTTRSAAATRSPSRCSRRPTAGSGAAASARRCSRVGGNPLLPAAQTDLIYAVIVNEAGLIGACGAAARLPAARRARDAHRGARARRLLEAAGRRADDRRRAAGLRDRRRRDEA